jgi:Restriction endonuclease
MRLPQDLANLLAIAIRDVIWFRSSVRSFLAESGVPTGILIETDAMRRDRKATIPIIHHVLDRLAENGAEGFTVSRKMLTRIFYWNDLHTVPADRKDSAVKSLKAFREGYERFRKQNEYQEELERASHEDWVKRSSIRAINHERLQSFRAKFDQIYSMTDRQRRGNEFQSLMNQVFDYYSEQSKGAFNRTGEQIDGLFYFDKHWYYVEVRWKDEKANAADISVLRDRAKNAYGGDTKALFISFNGFSEDCLESLKGPHDERVILMDGYDLRCVLNCDIPFDVLLAEKQADIVQNQRAFISVGDIIARRRA